MSEALTKAHYLDPEVLQSLGDLELIAREVVEGLRVGSHRSPLRGFSTEFAHHRQYSPGDAIRDIDWRVFGRTERYYTKLYEAETNYDCHLLIDASNSMNYASAAVSKLEYAKFLAASLAYIVLRQRDSVGLSVFDAEVRAYLPPRSTMGILVQIDRLLREARSVPRTTIDRQLHDIALLVRRRSFVVVISDFLADVEGILGGLGRLRFDGHNVLVIQTLDPHEIAFPFTGTWRFEGLEQEEPLTTQPERIRAGYLTRFAEHQRALRAGCVANRIDYALADTSRPLDAFLAEFFNAREGAIQRGGSARP